MNDHKFAFIICTIKVLPNIKLDKTSYSTYTYNYISKNRMSLISRFYF